MSIFIQSIFAFFAIIAFSIVINAPKRCLVINGLLGMAGWAAYLFAARYIGSQLAATFISGLILAIASHILARALKSPVTTFLIPAILTIVPAQVCTRQFTIFFCLTLITHCIVLYIQ